MSLGTALFLALTCYSAYRLFRHPFFSVCAIAWAANAAYLLFELFYEGPTFNLARARVTYIAALPFAALFTAASVYTRRRDWRKRDSYSIASWVLVVSAAFWLSASNLCPSTTGQFMVMAVPGTLWSMWAIASLGYGVSHNHFAFLDRVITTYGERNVVKYVATLQAGTSRSPIRLDTGARPEFPGSVLRALTTAGGCLVLSTWVYSVLQAFYLTKPYYKSEDTRFQVFFASLFVIGVGAKLLMAAGIGMLAIAAARLLLDIATRRSAAAELGIVAAAVEHEARTPLSNLFKLVAILPGAGAKADEISGSQLAMQRQLERLETAIDTVTLMRETRPAFAAKLGTENLIDIIHSAIRSEKESGRPEPVRIGFQLDPDISAINAKVDRSRIRQALVNVLNNAIEASTERYGLEYPYIVVKCWTSKAEDAGRSCTIEVADRGGGISDVERKRVTEPLFSTKGRDRHPNRGLGLYVTQRIAELHNGRLDIDSDGKSFTTVRLVLPKDPQDSVARGEHADD